MLFLHIYIKSKHPKIFRIFKDGKKKFYSLRITIFYITFLFPALILKKCNIIFLRVNIGRIGHLVFDTEAYIKERKLYDSTFKKPVLLAPRGKVANTEFLKYLKEHVILIQNKFLCKILFPAQFHPLCSVNSSSWGEQRSTFKSLEIDSVWESRGLGPLTKILPEHLELGNQVLKNLGLPSAAWYVCIHNRESGYSGNSHDFDQGFRNGKISSYLLAAREVVRRGGWCIRMGDPTMEPLNLENGIIDYAHSPFRSDAMDIFLCATSKVFLGNSSGLSLLAAFFGTTVGAANQIPLANCLMQGSSNVSIPKLITLNGRIVPFHELLESPAGSYRSGEEFHANNYSYIDNNSEELLDLLIELLDPISLENLSEYNELQYKFRKLLKPHHWCYHATGRIGTKFLIKYEKYL
jgi:putative glycosyltransferase (TIGR04372 family)